MITCDFCSRALCRHYNMLKHRRTEHADVLKGAEEAELSDSAYEEEQTYSDDDNKYVTSENEQDNSSHDEEDDSWNEIVNDALEECQPQ